MNIDSLHQALNDKKNENKETSGEALHRENIYDLNVTREEVVDDIERCTQEASNIECEIRMFSVS